MPKHFLKRLVKHSLHLHCEKHGFNSLASTGTYPGPWCWSRVWLMLPPWSLLRLVFTGCTEQLPWEGQLLSPMGCAATWLSWGFILSELTSCWPLELVPSICKLQLLGIVCPDKRVKKEREQEICAHRVQVSGGLLSPINHMVTIIIKV